MAREARQWPDYKTWVVGTLAILLLISGGFVAQFIHVLTDSELTRRALAPAAATAASVFPTSFGVQFVGDKCYIEPLPAYGLANGDGSPVINNHGEIVRPWVFALTMANSPEHWLTWAIIQITMCAAVTGLFAFWGRPRLLVRQPGPLNGWRVLWTVSVFGMAPAWAWIATIAIVDRFWVSTFVASGGVAWIHPAPVLRYGPAAGAVVGYTVSILLIERALLARLGRRAGLLSSQRPVSCPTCDYEISDAARCPECGREAPLACRPEVELRWPFEGVFRRRRVAVLALLVGCLYAAPLIAGTARVALGVL